MRTILFIVAASMLWIFPARAATTVYASGVYASAGATSNLANAFGVADGLTAGIGGSFTIFGITIGTAGQATYLFNAPITGAGTQFSALAGPVAPVRIAIGEIVGGVATFSTEIAFNSGPGGASTYDLSGLCASVSSTGCSLIRVRTNGALFGGPYLLDGISGVAAAPEPASWTLVIAGFGAIGWRLTARRALKARIFTHA